MSPKNKTQATLGSYFSNKNSQKPEIKKPEPVTEPPSSQATTEAVQETRKRLPETADRASDDENPLTQAKKRKRNVIQPEEDEEEKDEEEEEEERKPSLEEKEDTDMKNADAEFDKEIEEAEAEELEQETTEREMKIMAKTLLMDWVYIRSGMETADAGAKAQITWKKGQPIPYAALCKTFELCESTTKRTAITEYIVSLFLQAIKLTPDGLLELLYMCINKLCPDYEGLELGVGESFLMKAIAQSTGRDMKQIKADYRETGDLGTVAKSQTKKIDKIKGLLVACQDNEAKYLIRQLEGKLRIGLAEQTVLSALAHSVVLHNTETKKMSPQKKEQELAAAADLIKSVYNQLPCYDMIIPALLKYPLDELLSKCTMRPGIPLKPMLAHPTKSLTDVLDRFEGKKFTCEFKYDGERAQIHRLDDLRTMIYSRNSENMSDRYPDVMSKLGKWIRSETTSFIIDCEAVAWDCENKVILPFQVLSTRKRKDVKEEDIKVKVAIFAFDCLYLNGQSLLQEPLEKRREKLQEAFTETENEFYFARHMDSNNIEDIQTFLDTSISSNCEGLMVKAFEGAEATYEPSKRSRNWLKVKKDYLTGIGDSVDLVVIGAFYGRGKRTAVYGAFLLACYDPDTEEYQTICKLGTGFSEEDLQRHYDTLKEHVIDKPKRFYCLGENPVKPDVWFEPVQVWEVRCADLSISPRYMAAVGQVDPAKGISLRFPRFIRVRDDKQPEDATSSEQVRIMTFYNSQGNNGTGFVNEEGIDY
ncbi:tRNA ligase [Apophysomyces ossiformis]|uniref:DNA ligase n=1 Tax=Apophysomyces ossiformis TaxID=679940 RepID=A0A8H7ERM4_9FUNG|nr:tRNA ligase [Apophysomyces ossiformis]